VNGGGFAVCLREGRLRWWADREPQRVPWVEGEVPAALLLTSGYAIPSPELGSWSAERGLAPAKNTAEAIALGWRRSGPDLARHLYGQFSACVVSPHSQELVLLQDALGLAAGFYAAQQDGICLATRLGDLLHLMPEAALDPCYVALCLRRAGFLTTRTPYAGILRLVHGRTLAWRSGRAIVRDGWKPELCEQPRGSIAEEAHLLREAVEQAVGRAMLADGPSEVPPRIWCEWSSGLDSTTVLAIASARLGDVAAFSWLSDGAPGSDAALIRSLAPRWSGTWHALETASFPPFGAFPPAIRVEPGGAIQSARSAALRDLLHAHRVDIVLTGMGGDLAFGSVDVLPHHLAEGLLRWRPWRTVRDVRLWTARGRHPRSALSWLRTYVWAGLSGVLRCRPWSAPPPPAWLRYEDSAVASAGDDFLPRFPRGARHGRRMLWQEAYILAAMLARDERSGLGSLRHPLLDRGLLEHCLSLSYALRSNAVEDRVLQRIAFRGHLPADVLARRVKGTAQAALDMGLRRSKPWRAFLREARHLRDLGLIHADQWSREVDRAAYGVYESTAHFVIACELEAWLAIFPSFRPSRERPWRYSFDSSDADQANA
jgi:asparagine synthase (glutamine-hydrolysing)